METLTLHCWVSDEDTSNVFGVNISMKTVADLQEVIKNKTSVKFHNVDARHLDLYSILLPDDEHIRDELTGWTSRVKKRLLPRVALSKCFSPDEGQWLIIVNALKLTCWVHGETTDALFSVRVSSVDSTVEELKAAVQAKRQVIFRYIPVVSIKLYQAPDLTADDLEETAEGILSERPLLAVAKLAYIFPDPPSGRIQIIVRNPASSGQTTTEKSNDILAMMTENFMRTIGAGQAQLRHAGDEKDVLVALAETFQHTITSSKSVIPPAVAKPGEYARFQAGSRHILDGCSSANSPFNTVALPIQLFNPAFAFFSSKALDPTYTVHDGDVRAREHTMPVMLEAIQRFLTSLVENSSGFMVQSSREKLPPYLIIAEKNKFGDGVSDPSVQASFSYLYRLSQPKNKESCLRSCCPTFIIAYAGPWLSILGGVVVGRCIVQRLTDYVWVPTHSALDDKQFFRIARIFGALRESLGMLDSWYKKLDATVAPYDYGPVFHPRFWPSPNSYRERGTDALVEFTYQKPLENYTNCITFLAKTRQDEPKDIVVKFVTSYGAEAHKFMASKGFAPRLLYYGEIIVSPDMPSYSYGDLRMVVMEYVNGWAVHDPSKGIPSSFKSDVIRAFQHLHSNGYVFGDVWMQNITVLPEGTSESTAQLIDFDWAGKEGEVKYPISMNENITWPDGVEGLAYIQKRHDVEMLECMMHHLP